MRRKTVFRIDEETQKKVRSAISAISSQTKREIRCPYCHHIALVVFADARGHVQTKCKCCGKENVFDVVNMRRLRRIG